MDENDRINVGDIVIVNFVSSKILWGRVLYAPGGTGDSWILKGCNGDITYVNTFERMDKQRKL